MIKLLEVIPNSVTLRIGRQILMTQKHSPTILFAGGVVGVIATAVVASKATMQLSDTLDEAKNDIDLAKKLIVDETREYTEAEYRKDIAVIYARTAGNLTKLYAPAIGIGIVSVACLTGSHYVLTQRNVALTAAYTALDKGFRVYRNRVIEEFGPEMDRRFRYETEYVTHDYYDERDGKQRSEVVARAKKTPNDYSIYARFFDQTCGSVWSPVPEYNRIFLQAQQNHANDLLRARGHVFLNEVYDSLGIPRTKAGQVVGWVMGRDGDNYVDFGIFDGDRPAIRDFVNGNEGSILLDFNVDGVVYDQI